MEPISFPLQWEELRTKVEHEIQPALDAVFRQVEGTDDRRGLVVYLEGTVNAARIDDHLIPPLQLQALGTLKKGSVLNGEPVASFQEAIQHIYLGYAVLFIEGRDEAFTYAVGGGKARSIKEPDTETVIRGPREGFIERLDANLALIRNILSTPEVKFEPFTMGVSEPTKVVLAYHAGIAKKKILDEVRRRLNDIKLDAVVESGVIQEYIEDRPRSLFPQLVYTERPDSVAGHLLEGRFAILVNGSPFALIGPVTFWQMFHSPEDYYEKYIFSTFLMWLRYGLLFVSLFLPATYVAIISFHHELLPTNLMLSFAASREAIPFPALVEALIMEVSFEALREAGVRLPRVVGQTVSILGALIIGQAAVQAGIVSAPMVIVVSMTGIASFATPKFNFGIAIRLLRFPIMLMGGLFGLYGIIIGTVLILVHLVNLQSFGVPYMSGIAPLRRSSLKDILWRAPWYKMITRPPMASDRIRQQIRNRK